MKKLHRIAILFFLFTTFLLYFNHNYSSDSGLILNGAWNLYNGKIIYKDFFEYISPGSFYFVYGIFLLFGPSYIMVKLISALFLLFTLFLIYRINLLLSSNERASYYPTLFWLIIISFNLLINHNAYSTFLTIIFTYVFILFIKKPKNTLVLYSGILAALIFYFLQTKGLLIIFSSFLFILYLIKQKKAHLQHLLYFLGGLASIFSLGILFWGQVVFTYPLLMSENYLQANQVSHICYILFIILTIIPWWYFKKHNKLTSNIIFLLFIQSALFLSILNRPDIYHILLNSFPLIILYYLFIKDNYYKFEYLYTIKIIKITFFILLTLIYGLIINDFFIRLDKSLKVKVYLNHLRQEIGEEKIFSHPFMPGLYFELKKQNPYYTNVIETIQGNKTFLLKNLNILKENSPKYILTNYKIAEFADYKINAIDNYIFKYYSPIEKYAYLTIWRKI